MLDNVNHINNRGNSAFWKSGAVVVISFGHLRVIIIRIVQCHKMWINICAGLSLICAVLSTATPSPSAKPKATFDYQVPLIPDYQVYSNNFGFGGHAAIPLAYTSPSLYGYNQHYYNSLPFLTGYSPSHINVHPSFTQTQHAYIAPHAKKFRGFAYHNDFSDGSTANVIYLTGPGVSQVGFPSVQAQDDSLAVQIARTKASNALDKNAIVKDVPFDVKTNTLCDTFATLNGGLHNFYSFDNAAPLFPNAGFDYNYGPFYTGAGTYPNDYPGNFKIVVPEDGLRKDDKNGIDRKIKVVIPDAKPENTVPDRKVDVTIPDEKVETPISNPEPVQNENTDVALPNLTGNGGSEDSSLTSTTTDAAASSSEGTTKSGDDDENDDEKEDSKKKKRQSVRAIRGRKF